ncbi:hypothetical protein SNEBB_009602 [Seison nebaliae]|nr:hypothetical protein SNEBB_009602 [Seison nebaliae]
MTNSVDTTSNKNKNNCHNNSPDFSNENISQLKRKIDLAEISKDSTINSNIKTNSNNSDSKKIKLSLKTDKIDMKKLNLETEINGTTTTATDSAIGNPNPADGAAQEIDYDLYSRQVYVLGDDAMRSMAGADIMICGMNGLGVEIAKNLVLAGVHRVTLYDNSRLTMSQLSSNYFGSVEQVGQTAATVAQKKLKELNEYVTVDVLQNELTSAVLKTYQIVIIVSKSLELCQAMNDMCRAEDVKFMMVDTKGLTGQLFVDFGRNFIIKDTDGEQAIINQISMISQEEEGIITVVDDTRHGYEDGTYVEFSEIQGMEKLNEQAPMPIKVLGPYSFSISDTRYYDKYISGGLVKSVKRPKEISMKMLKESLEEPEFLISDYAKMDRPADLHVIFRSMNDYFVEKASLPRPWNEEDANRFYEIAKTYKEDVNEKLTKIFSYTSRGDLSPIQSIFGSIAAQEAIKGTTGKYTPINQWLYFDAYECLPNNLDTKLDENNCQAMDNRYDGETMVFGNEFVKKLNNQKYFVIGAGAIGCEMLKNFAMMGIGCGEDGNIVVTDMDTISRSNLNRQFLFRPWDISKSKSECAARAIKEMNPNVNIEPQLNKVGPETENVYTEKFFNSLNAITNALDNVEARLYVDRRCIFSKKPLIDSGTLGTKGNVQVIIPHITESYGSSQDPPEKSIPMCTVKNFPSAIEHCIQWARERFESLFYTPAVLGSLFIDDQVKCMETISSGAGSKPLEDIKCLKETLLNDVPKNFDDCVTWARLKWEEDYNNSIRQLLFNFPTEQRTQQGAPFWSAPKRCPHELHYDAKDELHLNYIYHAAALRADMYGLTVPPKNDEELNVIIKDILIPEFKPASGIKIAVDDTELKNQVDNSDSEQLSSLTSELIAKISKGKMKLNAIEFEKDDDKNHHMDFIVACSNLRATNYSIETADKHKTKMIAGKIIPAMATTTSLVVGLACLEVYKIAQGLQDIEQYRNSFLNLALPYIGMSEPIGAPKKKYGEEEWTLWDRIEIDGEITLGEFIDHIEDKCKVKIQMISCDVFMIFGFFQNKSLLEERLATPITQLVQTIGKKPIEPHVHSLVMEVCAIDLEENDVDLPYIKYNLPKQK